MRLWRWYLGLPTTEFPFIQKKILSLITSQARYSDHPEIALLLKTLKTSEKIKPYIVEIIDSIFEEMVEQIERQDFKES